MRASIVVILLVWTLTAVVSASDIVRDPAGTGGLALGTCVSGLGDQDGDGTAEILVGAPGADAAGQDAGRVYLWIGGLDISFNANEMWNGTTAGEQFGHAVARIGDLDGDGVDDFAVGAPLSNATSAEGGRVYVFYGGWPLSATADLVLESPATGGRFGWSITALGDLDGDDRDDFAVGAPWDDTNGVETGAVFVYYGASGGPAATPDLTLRGSLPGERFGWSVAGVGEFLGGNARCLAVGAPSNATAAGARQGRAYIYAGSTSPNPGPDTDVDLTLISGAASTADDQFGYSVAAVGGFDGDNDPDLAVGAPYCADGGLQRGRVEVFYGGLDADAVADRYCGGPASGARLGWSVAGVGDVVGSGADDVLIGAPYDDTPATEAGRAFLWAGGAGDVPDADSLPTVERTGLVDAAAEDLFGFWCASLGDLDGDGLADYAVGAPAGNVISNAVAGWVRFVDSSGEATPVRLSGWDVAWTDDGGVEATARVAGLSPPEVASVRLERRDRLGVVVLHDGGLGGPTRLVAGELGFSDPDAAWQTRGDVVYRLTLRPTSGGVVTAEVTAPLTDRPSLTAQLAPAAPNPFNPATSLRWRATAGQPVEVAIIDLRGRRVRSLFTGPATGAWQSAPWRGTTGAGHRAAAGIYLVRLRTGETTVTRPITLLP